MVHDKIAPRGAAPIASDASGREDDYWCILRTSGGRTGALAKSLAGAGFDVWSPMRTIKRPAPGQRRALVLGTRRRMIEVEVPILPGFVFARARHLNPLAHLAADPAHQHPPFSIFRFAGRAPLVHDRSVSGLRDAEALAETMAQAERDAESREAARRVRAEHLRTERARRKALRSERKDFAEQADVVVAEMPALAGVVGKVVRSKGAAVTIDFGGALIMKVEAWRVFPAALQTPEAHTGIAA